MSDGQYLSKRETDLALRQQAGRVQRDLVDQLQDAVSAGLPVIVDGKPVDATIVSSSRPAAVVHEDEIPVVAARFGI